MLQSYIKLFYGNKVKTDHNTVSIVSQNQISSPYREGSRKSGVSRSETLAGLDGYNSDT